MEWMGQERSKQGLKKEPAMKRRRLSHQQLQNLLNQQSRLGDPLPLPL